MARAPAWAPYPSRSTSVGSSSTPPPRAGVKLKFSPLLIAMMVAVAAAFLVVTYSRLLSRHLVQFLRRYRHWRHRRRRLRYMMPSYSYSVTTFSNLESPSIPFESSFSPDLAFSYGLDDSVIKTIPLSLYSKHKTDPEQLTDTVARDCAVCLLEFEENDYVRTLPICFHAFHLDCIDIWLRSHANCPLCRGRIFFPDSPFVPVMASRIRPSLDDAIFANSISLLEPVNAESIAATVTEIMPFEEERLQRRSSLHNLSSNYSEDNINLSHSGRLLKRSYSFGFERTSFLAPSETMLVTEPATASPWKFRGAGFWAKRPLTPFKSRVFSSRYYRGGTVMKSPGLFRRRTNGGGTMAFPWSERFSNIGSGWGSSSSRRSKSAVSPMFLRSTAAAFSSSRLRCGDPEALLSPERFTRR